DYYCAIGHSNGPLF
nr:immunoglobulin light chain junction region [Macaca mulatta]MOY09554.1 immunoglobulin light chain junction region [Macaca mulatta]